MSSLIKKTFKAIAHPSRAIDIIRYKYMVRNSCPKDLCDYLYCRVFKRRINWENPEDLNQWIAWLQFKTDTTLWETLADKYRMHDYLKERGFGEYLVPVLAKWETADDMDFTALPDSFVLKCNNGSGDVRIVKDKSKADIAETREYFRMRMARGFGRDTAEPHYLRMKPLVMAERLLDATLQSTESASLIDYKFWCFNGEVDRVFVCSDRTGGYYSTEMYDTGWNNISDTDIIRDGHTGPSKQGINRPVSFDTMIKVASTLSKGLPQVRIDFYEIDGRPYVGELTLTAACGRMTHYTPEVLKEMGMKCGAAVRSLIASGELRTI